MLSFNCSGWPIKGQRLGLPISAAKRQIESFIATGHLSLHCVNGGS